ncbi:type IV toxin-antitoxin system AbiEi family antitoxin domain-containing protein [Cupriavidus necator]|uniref:type IV toxin-antitoxin system AbiEi family antitoxin domain-containing protein n=1 Tax=Cupriavidus necator TaxID=106590 RepID=UPI00339D81FD
MSAVLDLEVGDADLAALVGVSPRWVREFAKRGALERIGRNKYRLGDALPALVAELTGGDIGEQISKARLAKLTADAEMAQLELVKAKALVAPVEQMQRVMESTFVEVRTNMRNLPSRTVSMLIGETNERRFKDVMLAEIDLALVGLADTLSKQNFGEDADDDNEDDPEHAE